VSSFTRSLSSVPVRDSEPHRAGLTEPITGPVPSAARSRQKHSLVEGDRIGQRPYRVRAPRFQHDVRAFLTSKGSSAGVEHERRRVQGTAPAIAIRVVENDGRRRGSN
jgi:hypothetical protein